MTTSDPAPASGATGQPAQRVLTARQQRFVAEYLIDLNASAAARRAGYSERTADAIGRENLGKPTIAAAIQEAMSAREQRTEISQDRVLQEAWNILTADPRQLVEYRVGCCRHCWGLGHRYQRTPAEFERDLAAFQAVADRPGEEPRVFDQQGGVGFHGQRAPNPDCPECFGEGAGRVVFKDTRQIDGAAASLFAGIRQTRDGLDVKMHSKLDALDRLFKHLGLFERFRTTGVAAEQIRDAKTLADQGRAVIAGATAGELPVGQASQLLGALGTLAKLIETDELVARIAALEAKNGNQN